MHPASQLQKVFDIFMAFSSLRSGFDFGAASGECVRHDVSQPAFGIFGFQLALGGEGGGIDR
jgi:hypothetical protein